MKKFSKITIASMFLGITFGVMGCGSDPTPTVKFNFSFSALIGDTESKGKLYYGTDKVQSIKITQNNDSARTYTYYSENEDYLSIDNDGIITTHRLTDSTVPSVDISVMEDKSEIVRTLKFTIVEEPVYPAGGVDNSAAVTGQDIDKRTEILGKLEKYAMEKFLTGIPLFENGGYVRYSDRLVIPAKEYVTGYGLGILREGDIKKNQDGTYVRLDNIEFNPTEDHPEGANFAPYYQSASSSDPAEINAWNATGSQVSDLFSYISSSYWGTKLDSSYTDYEWYPVLATDQRPVKDDKGNIIGLVANDRPVPQDKPNKLGLYKKWRIYVKTGATDGLQYRTASELRGSYDNRDVTLADYEFVYQMLLTEQSQLVRGSELAGDTTYGIKGGQAFYRSTKTKKLTDDTKLANEWERLKRNGTLGIDTGTESYGGRDYAYIDIELVTAIDAFTAMYTLSSNLYAPIPQSFMSLIGGGQYVVGAQNYGKFNMGTGTNNILDYTLCCGPFYLEKWTKNQETVFTKNEKWFEYTEQGAYKIPGVRIRVVSEATQVDDALYSKLNKGLLDSAGIPKSHIDDKDESAYRVYKATGDSTFKLNVNSTTQERWNELFGKNGTISKGQDDAYKVKPWMSNNNFLRGIYWSINRKNFAESRGVNPSYNYFANSYLADPQGKSTTLESKSYNESPAHKQAVADFHNGEGLEDDYGFNEALSIAYFKQAVQELVNEGLLTLGTKDNPTNITFHIKWMYQTDVRDYGAEIGKYIEDCFNARGVCNNKVKLTITQDAVQEWSKVYYDFLMPGKYDLGFGAISGNTYNPLNFMEVLKSDNSSGFTLNWGADTSKVDVDAPIMYDGKAWSYDALWAAADHGTIVSEGKNVAPVAKNHITEVSKDAIYQGATIKLAFEFIRGANGVQLEGIDLDVDKIEISLLGTDSLVFLPESRRDDGTACDGYFETQYDSHGNIIGFVLNVDATKGAAKNREVVDNNELEKSSDHSKWISDPFSFKYYGDFWDVEVFYSLTIAGGSPAQNISYTAKNAETDESGKNSIAKF